jgi:ring-1,2-phenylacetyl-CoA epoxidase subunit PaaE
MSIHFYPLRIKKINKETDQCVSVEFDVPENLANTFQFKQAKVLP